LGAKTKESIKYLVIDVVSAAEAIRRLMWTLVVIACVFEVEPLARVHDGDVPTNELSRHLNLPSRFGEQIEG
jgi:hypothetical protein